MFSVIAIHHVLQSVEKKKTFVLLFVLKDVDALEIFLDHSKIVQPAFKGMNAKVTAVI